MTQSVMPLHMDLDAAALSNETEANPKLSRYKLKSKTP